EARRGRSPGGAGCAGYDPPCGNLGHSRGAIPETTRRPHQPQTSRTAGPGPFPGRHGRGGESRAYRSRCTWTAGDRNTDGTREGPTGWVRTEGTTSAELEPGPRTGVRRT